MNRRDRKAQGIEPQNMDLRYGGHTVRVCAVLPFLDDSVNDWALKLREVARGPKLHMAVVGLSNHRGEGDDGSMPWQDGYCRVEMLVNTPESIEDMGVRIKAQHENEGWPFVWIDAAEIETASALEFWGQWRAKMIKAGVPCAS